MLPRLLSAAAISLVACGPALAETLREPAKRAPAGLVVAQGAGAPAGRQPAPPASGEQIIQRANAYLNGFTTLVGGFVQIGGDGKRLPGTLYLQRPGKLRFDYDPPATIEVVADGSSVVVRDRKLATQDLYPISQTPLKFLTRDQIDLARDVTITGAVADQDGVRVQIEDSTTFGGTSKITLYFDPPMTKLLRWRIVDAQGFQTTVQLANLDTGRRVDPRVFNINYQRDIAAENPSR